MKLLLFLACASSLAAASVVEVALDPHAVVDLPVSREVTTLTLPGPLSAVVGSDLVLDTGRGTEVDPAAAPRFHVTHIPNAPFVHVRALKDSGTARLTLLFEHRAYVIAVRAVPTDSVASVIFVRPPAAPPNPTVQLPSPPRSPPFTQALLDRARAFPLIAQSMPRATAGMTSRIEDRRIPHPDLEIRLQEVVRFHAEDALVFLLVLENRTSANVIIDPTSFAASVGPARFPQTIARAPRILKPGEKAAAEFAIIGLPDGSRHDLSLENRFSIELSTHPEEES